MWWIAVIKLVAMIAASVFIQKLLAPKPDKPQPKGLSDFSIPTADATRAIPVVFGSVKITGPNVIWYGNLGVEPFKLNGQDAGFYYTLGLDLAVCHGPVDSFDGLRFDDKSAGWSVYDAGDGTNYATYSFGNTMLFGGNKSGGGVMGRGTVYFGTTTQLPDGYMQAACSADYPGLAGVCHLVLHGGYKPQYGGVYLGTSEYLKPVSVFVTRCPNPFGWSNGHHRISVDGGYDANPACMVYEILTNTTWGLGIDPAGIDTASFTAAGETLFTEGFGLAMILEEPTEATETIREILRHIDGGLTTDPTTGKLSLRLIRADYVIGSLPVLDESAIDEVEYTRASWSETFNVAKIAFTSRADGYTPRIAQWQNLANLQVQGGTVVSQIDYRGLSNSRSAGIVAARVLKLGCYPFAKVTFKANRKAWALRQCDVFVLDWPPLGISGMVCRVTKPAGGQIQDGRMTIECIEDAFAVSSTVFSPAPSSGWVDPVGPVSPCAQQALFEAPYQVAGGAVRQLLALAARADGSSNGFQIWSDPAGGTAYGETNIVPGWCPYGALVGAYAASTAATDATGFGVQTLIDADSLVSCSALELGYGLNLALIDSEIIAWQTVSGSGSTRTIANVMRGVLDTVPAAHSAGAKVWFFTSGARGVVNPTGGYTSDGAVTAKLLPYNLRYTLAISLATQLSATLASRALKPLPPGNVKIGGVAWPTSLAHAVDIAVTWAHRHRVSQAAAGVVVAQDAGDYVASPEGSYTVEVRVGGTLKRTVTAIAGTSWTWTAAMQATDGGVASAAVTIRVIPVNGSLTGTYQERGFTLT